jgi:hypothetical protein
VGAVSAPSASGLVATHRGLLALAAWTAWLFHTGRKLKP